MSDRQIFTAEKVFIKDFVEGGTGNTTQPGTGLRPSPDHVSLSQTTASPAVRAPAENKPDHVAAGTAYMETAVDKHRGISKWQCPDTAGRDEKHRIKLSYKSLAAIPTNSLLLDQQAIDEQVGRGEALDSGGLSDGGVADTHAEMCSPAQLRQQSEELYAVIDEILANSNPTSLQSSRSSTPNPGPQKNSSFPKSLGHETKYASLCSLYSSSGVERNLMGTKKTKPGVIRPMTAIPRLTVEDKDEFHSNPFRQSEDKATADNKKVETGKEFYTSLKHPVIREERKPERRTLLSLCDLQISEPVDHTSHPLKVPSTSFSPAEEQMEVFQTHI